MTVNSDTSGRANAISIPCTYRRKFSNPALKVSEFKDTRMRVDVALINTMFSLNAKRLCLLTCMPSGIDIIRT